MRVGTSFIVAVLVLGSGGQASAVDSSWFGTGSKTFYTEVCDGAPCHETERVELTCERDRRLAIWIGVESQAGANTSVGVTIDVDGKGYPLRGTTDDGGLFGYTPTVIVPPGSALPEALMHGQRFRIFLGGGGKPVFASHLRGTRQVFNRHLSRCL